jgi:hypothetical protein
MEDNLIYTSYRNSIYRNYRRLLYAKQENFISIYVDFGYAHLPLIKLSIKKEDLNRTSQEII